MTVYILSVPKQYLFKIYQKILKNCLCNSRLKRANKNDPLYVKVVIIYVVYRGNILHDFLVILKHLINQIYITYFVEIITNSKAISG